MICFVEWCTYCGQLCLIKSPFSSTANARPQAKKRKVATKITVSKNRRGRQIKQFAIAKIKQYMPRMSFFNTPYFFLEIVTPRRIRRQVNQWKLTSFSRAKVLNFRPFFRRGKHQSFESFFTIQISPKVTQGVWFIWACSIPRRSFLSDFTIRRFFRRCRRRFKGQQFSHLPQTPKNPSQLFLSV